MRPERALVFLAAFFLTGGEARAQGACGGWNYATVANCEYGSQPSTCVRDFYVAQGSNGNGSQGSPWGSIQQANDSGVTAGDCVHVGPGTYSGANLTRGGNSNSPAGYVTYIGAPGHASKVLGSGAYNVLQLGASYIALNGFDIDGQNIGAPPPGGPGITNGNGVVVTGATHHIMVLNNLIHDFPNTGLGGAGGEDYMLFSGNTIYNTAYGSCWGTSGLTIYEPVAMGPSSAADQCPFHIVVANNVTYNNRQGYPATCLGQTGHTDGNGIILDDWNHTQCAHTCTPYGGQGLVQGNGGAGIQNGNSSNVTLANNVAFNNCLDPLVRGCADLTDIFGQNNNWINNVAWSGHGEPTLATWQDQATWTNNFTSGDPMLDPITLQPLPGSPVTAAGITPPVPGVCTPGIISTPAQDAHVVTDLATLDAWVTAMEKALEAQVAAAERAAEQALLDAAKKALQAGDPQAPVSCGIQ